MPAQLSITSAINRDGALRRSPVCERRESDHLFNGRGRHSRVCDSLPGVIQNPKDLDARAQAQYGAWLGGVSLGAVGMALHHKLCHTLGGSFNLPHAETHTIVLAARGGL